MYSVREISKSVWEAFVLSSPWTLFVQSPEYGDFFTQMGESAWYIGLYDDTGSLVGGSLVVSTHAKRANFLYLPYGPIIPDSTEACHTLCQFLKKFAKEKKYHFIRISPFLQDTREMQQLFRDSGAIPAPMHVLAENTWLLDVTKDDTTLLSGMKKNHRNLISRLEREGVVIHEMRGDQGLDILHRMLDETEKRHHFTRFSRRYIDTEFAQFEKKGAAKLFVSQLPDGRYDAATIIFFYGTMAVYRHSASLNLNPHLPTSYLIQWRVIREARQRGMRWYNFWGVEPVGEKNHPFSGIGHFKRGFGGQQMDLLHCQDIPLSFRYYANWMIETIRRKRRGF